MVGALQPRVEPARGSGADTWGAASTWQSTIYCVCEPEEPEARRSHSAFVTAGVLSCWQMFWGWVRGVEFKPARVRRGQPCVPFESADASPNRQPPTSAAPPCIGQPINRRPRRRRPPRAPLLRRPLRWWRSRATPTRPARTTPRSSSWTPPPRTASTRPAPSRWVRAPACEQQPAGAPLLADMRTTNQGFWVSGSFCIEPPASALRILVAAHRRLKSCRAPSLPALASCTHTPAGLTHPTTTPVTARVRV